MWNHERLWRTWPRGTGIPIVCIARDSVCGDVSVQFGPVAGTRPPYKRIHNYCLPRFCSHYLTLLPCQWQISNLFAVFLNDGRRPVILTIFPSTVTMNAVTSSSKPVSLLLLLPLLSLIAREVQGWPWPSLASPTRAVGRGVYTKDI